MNLQVMSRRVEVWRGSDLLELEVEQVNREFRSPRVRFVTVIRLTVFPGAGLGQKVHTS
jgi:hypothetical protein